jgi:hypothetical protein
MTKNTVAKILMLVAAAVAGLAASPEVPAAYAGIVGIVATLLGTLAGLFHASPASIADKAASGGVGPAK